MYVVTPILLPFFIEEHIDFGLQVCIQDFEAVRDHF